MKIPLSFVPGLKIRASDGLEERGFPAIAGTARFYKAEAGDRLVLQHRRYTFNVATYRAEIKDKWIYTYDYSPNEAWVVYNGDLCGKGYRQEEYIFAEDTYFRCCLRNADGGDFCGEAPGEALLLEKPDVLRFALLSDSHYVTGGGWDTTAGAIWTASRRQKLDGVIHLGDFTDGMVTKELCIEYASAVLDDLRATGSPVWAALGNHDSNYFRGNPERLTLKEQCRLYLDREEPRYCVDFESHRLRLLFLDSFDPDAGLRYGFSNECVAWVEQTLKATPSGWSVIVFSHVTPLTRLQVWVSQIRGEAELLNVLGAQADKVLAFINGHQHADILCNDYAFPIITVGCAKCEHETVYKPAGAFTPERTPGAFSQELWDILSVDTANKTLTFRRQGAGKNRIVKDGKAQWL